MTTSSRLPTVPLRLPVPDGLQLGERDDERGASLVEYALLVAFIAIVCIAAVTLLGTSLAPEYSSIADGID